MCDWVVLARGAFAVPTAVLLAATTQASGSASLMGFRERRSGFVSLASKGRTRRSGTRSALEGTSSPVSVSLQLTIDMRVKCKLDLRLRRIGVHRSAPGLAGLPTLPL